MLNPKVRFWQEEGEFYIEFDSIGDMCAGDCLCGGGDFSMPEISIGMRDKFGRDLFEGDLVKHESGVIGEVLFWRAQGKFVISYDTDDNGDDYFDNLDQYEMLYEIVGNIHGKPQTPPDE